MKRAFISFRAEDRPQVNGLRLLAANPNFDIEFYDESVRTAYDSNNPEYIKRMISEKINRTSVTICLLSALTHTSSWVNWELEKSYEKGNSVILMGLPGVNDAIFLPPAAKARGAQWNLWNIDTLSRMIASS
jgi:hypothetical protein